MAHKERSIRSVVSLVEPVLEAIPMTNRGCLEFIRRHLVWRGFAVEWIFVDPLASIG